MTAENVVMDGGQDYLIQISNRHKGIFKDVLMERVRQELKWGLQEHDGDRWNTILAEEAGEIARAINELTDLEPGSEAWNKEMQNLREEIVQTMAVGAAWLEDWGRRGFFG